jgi:hypothetical protein
VTCRPPERGQIINQRRHRPALRGKETTVRFAIIETYTGHVWGVVDAETAEAACAAVDQQTDPSARIGGRYERVPASEARTTRCLYDVRVAPPGFELEDGPDEDVLAAVEALPRAGVYAWVGDDE